MGRSVDLYSYDAPNLIDGILKYCKTDDSGAVEEILSKFGTFMDDRYILLHQELWDGYNCYFNVARVLDRVFGVDDTFGNIFCVMNDRHGTDRKRMITAVEAEEVMEQLYGEGWEEKYPDPDDD